MTNNQKEAISILNRLRNITYTNSVSVITEEEYYLLLEYIVPDKREVYTYPSLNMPILTEERGIVVDNTGSTTSVSYDGSNLSVTGKVVDEQPTLVPSILDLELRDSRLSIRTLNCLKMADIQTVGDLVKCNRTDIAKIRNLGRHTLAEIDGFLKVLGLKLKSGVC